MKGLSVSRFAVGDAPAATGASAALGNMDGVHLGHQAVIADAARAAAALEAPLAAVVFDPHPRLFFQPDAAPFHLQTPGQRARALAALGVARVIELRFDADLASLTDFGFAAETLAQGLGLRHVSVGADFRFGRGRMGDAEALARHGRALGFSVGAVAPVGDGFGAKISSTAIRTALAEGRPEDAGRWLGRPFAIQGAVLTGFQRGRTIGVPTANVELGAYQRPAFGVYAVRADLGDGIWRAGVANVGVKPTVSSELLPLVETHVFDFEGDLYGRTIEVGLLHFLRPERKFESFEALTRQIAEDAAQARRLLSGAP